MQWRYVQKPCRKLQSWFQAECCQSSVDLRLSINMPACRLKSTARAWGSRSRCVLWPTIFFLTAGSLQAIKRFEALAAQKGPLKKNPVRCLFLFVVFVSSGSGFPPAKLQASPVHEDQTGACEWGFSHWADGVGYWTSPRGAQAGGGQSDSHMVLHNIFLY